MVEFFIAKRYARAKHKLNFISILSVISAIGITIGVAALIIVLAVFNGFGSIVTNVLINFDPHIKITLNNDEAKNHLFEAEKIIKEIPNVKSVNKIADGKALFINDKTYEVVNLKGVEIDTSKFAWNISSKMISGKFDLNNDNIILGLTLALKLGIRAGDKIIVTSAFNIEKTISTLSIPATKTFTVSGLYESDNKDYDDSYAFTSLQSAQVLFGMKNNFSAYEIRLQDFENAESIKTQLEKKLDKNLFTIETWYDLHKQLYNVMQIERWAAYIILCLIIAVATFNIFASLTMTVIEKKRDIGILRSLGLKQDAIKKIFMTSGLMIGFTGTFLGLLIGIIVCELQIKFKFYALDPSKYIIDALPVQIKLFDIIAISAMAILLSYLAAYFPAKKAAQTVIIESIKYE